MPSASRVTRPLPEPITDPVEAAQVAGLRYVHDDRPGIRRVRAGRGFRYVDPNGKPIRDPATLKRIHSLVIPPAWTDIWICPRADGHIQATGRDARGRKQYRYHPRWREVRDENKYGRMVEFGKALPRIREQTDHDLALPGLCREKVLATVVRLLEKTLIRVGNEEYARENHSFGLTTMRTKHVEVDGSTVHFEFRGKSGVAHAIDLRDRRLARIIERCQDLPGEELFQYLNGDGTRHPIGSDEVNAYLKTIAGQDFTAKDFRTWSGTVLTARTLLEFDPHTTQTEAKRNVVRAIEAVAKRLGNTKAVCRKCYVHPAVIDAYLDSSLCERLRQRQAAATARALAGLSEEEAAVLAFLQEQNP